ncbi:malonyl-CoA synthase [Oricola sp.]|uniref:malonate--CoA ligase n=1 Tax=Oricola sp. TaxID=1979950 RepID=UPI0025EF21D1|nr:malonyl-CoA synthase [Oricola sp.]MCI5075774.1 malonyl-CoA synthase [Oricola sp.]
MNQNLYAILSERFRDRLDRPCLVMTGRTLTYGDVDALAARIAGVIVASNVKPGDRVVVQVEKSAEAVALYLACLRTGAVFIPLNTAYTPSEVGYFLGDAEPALFVCTPENRDRYAAGTLDWTPPTILTLDAEGGGTLMQHAADAAPHESILERADDDLAAILYTSGTTGRSKGAMLTHANLSSNGLTLVDYWGFQPGDVLLHALPIFHVHGLFVALHCAMLNASPMLFMPKFDVAAVRAALPDATVMMGVPTFYTRLMDQADFSADECAHMRLFISGSAPLTAQNHEAFEQRSGHRILERYGMTEAGMITSNPYEGDRIAGTVGYALPGVEVRVCDDAGDPVHDEVGSIQVRGPNVFKGYWNMPEKTAEEFTGDGFFVTGDLGTQTEDGRVAIVGRGKDLIIAGGYNIYPKEIESVLDKLDGVVESAVIGAPHSDFGEGVVAVIVTDDGQPLDLGPLQAAIDADLARFKHPRAWRFVDTLPRNTMGKVQKNVLRDTYGDAFTQG